MITAGFAVVVLIGLALPMTVLGGDWETSIAGCTVTADQLCDPTDTDVDTSLYATACVRLTVECGATDQYAAEGSKSVLLLKHLPKTKPYKGTIVFGSGGPGASFYEDSAELGVLLVETMLAEGYVAVQRKWQMGWSDGVGGLRSISRRGAVMFDYIRNGPANLFEGSSYCATGNSGGSAEIAYALAHHGFDGGPGSVATFDGVVLSSGPPSSDLVTGCWGDIPGVYGTPLWWDPSDPTNPDSPSQLQGTPRPDYSDPDNPVFPLCYDRLDQDGIPFEIHPRDPLMFEAWAGVFNFYAEEIINGTIGGEGLCNLDEPSESDIAWMAGGSVLGPDAVYGYPGTNAYFLYGDEDCGEAVTLGLLYANEVTTNIDFIAGAQHKMPNSLSGVEALADALLLACGDPLCDGDANRDGAVDPLDTGYVLARLGCSVGIGDFDCNMADQNGDGAVDPLDSGYVLARFGECP